MERSRCSTVSSGSPDKKQRSQSRGKVRPDPVEDALDIRRRQQEAQRLLLEKRREKEMQVAPSPLLQVQGRFETFCRH
jgi:nucleosome binding factor SPN SPT16 subunit